MKTYRITMHLDDEFEVDEGLVAEIMQEEGLSHRGAEEYWFVWALSGGDPDSVFRHLVRWEQAEKVEEDE